MKQKSKFKQAEIGEIPEDWEELKLSEAVEVNPKRELKKGVSAKKVPMDCLSPFNKKIKSFEVSKFSGGSKFINGDTIMARITPCLENGKTAFVDILNDDEIGFGSTEFIVLSGKNGKTTNDFVYYLSISPQLRKEAIKSMTGTSGRQRVQNDLFEEIELIIPPLPEQSTIAKILSDLDSKIELNQQMNKALEEISRAIFKRWFFDFEFPNEKGKPYKSSGEEMVDSEIGEIPKGWELKRIKDCGQIVCGKTPPTKEKKNYGENIFFITIPDMHNKYLVINTERKLSKEGADTQKKKYLPPFTICVSCIATPGLVVLTSKISQTNQQINSIICNKNVSPYFMYLMMKEKAEEIKSRGLGGTATLNLNTGDFENIKLILPNEEILVNFHKLINGIFQKILTNEYQIQNLSQVRDSLLPKLMSGKIRVPTKERT